MVMGIFLDVQKGFDCVDHTLLITKLEHQWLPNRLLKSFLSGITQRVKLNDH